MFFSAHHVMSNYDLIISQKLDLKALEENHKKRQKTIPPVPRFTELQPNNPLVSDDMSMVLCKKACWFTFPTFLFLFTSNCIQMLFRLTTKLTLPWTRTQNPL